MKEANTAETSMNVPQEIVFFVVSVAIIADPRKLLLLLIDPAVKYMLLAWSSSRGEKLLTYLLLSGASEEVYKRRNYTKY
jgi:hypothetical protein